MAAEKILSTIAANVLSSLGSYAIQHIGLAWGVKGEMRKMETNISTINNILQDAQEQQMSNRAVKEWLERLKLILYDAEDLLDEVATETKRREVESLMRKPAVMALTTPFVRIVQREKYDKINNTGHWYVLINVHGEQEVAAFSKTRSSKNLVYEAHAPFVAKYGQILPIGTATKWDLRKEMDAWLSRIIYYSFLYFFDDYNGKCWFMKYISPHDEAEDEDDDMFMPAVQENIFKIQNPNKWILLKVGGKVWPVHVINNKMEDGWLEFYLGNHLTEGYTVLFGCERAWIFEAIILDQNLERCNGAEHNDVNPPAVTLKTAWVPSVLLADDYALQFAYLWTPESSLNQVFTHRFQAILQDPTVHEIVFRMNNWTWNVPIKNGRFQSVGLQMLENELHLEDSNLIFIAVKDPSNIRVLVFCSNGVEKMYLWFYE